MIFSCFKINKLLLFSLCLCSICIGGCSKNSDLELYNRFVESLNSGDYDTAYSLTNSDTNSYMNIEVFENSINKLDYFVSAKSVSYKDGFYNFKLINGNTFTCGISNNRLAISELFTELELYVPSGSKCSYNGINLNNSMITEDDGVESVYTIIAPIGDGILKVNNNLLGESERIVVPEDGDFDDFTLSVDMTKDIGKILETVINGINVVIDTGDKDLIYTELCKYNNDIDYCKIISDKLIYNRRLSDPFISYHNAIYKCLSVTANLSTSETVDVDADFNVKWVVGEDKKSEMTCNGLFIIEKNKDIWNINSISNYDFLLLNVVGGDGIE